MNCKSRKTKREIEKGEMGSGIRNKIWVKGETGVWGKIKWKTGKREWGKMK